jgi:hypothetical protein
MNEDKVVIGSNKIVDRKKYKHWVDKDIAKEALDFYVKPCGYGLTQFCAQPGRKVPLTSLKRCLKDCNIFEMKRLGKPIREADVALRVKLAKKKKNEKARVSAAGVANRYLTDNEELAIVQMCRVLSMCGRGVTKDELLNITNEYIHHHEDARLIQDATRKITRGLMGRHKELVKIVQASSMDPKRAEQAIEDTRDAMFFKLDSYIKSLYEMGHVSWKSYKEIPKENLFNMDVVGNDTTKHRSKIIADKVAIMARMFQMTPEGDGKMNMHMTACITTCVNGRYEDKENKIHGACGPLLIHTHSTSKTKEKDKEERARQRMGEEPMPALCSPRFREGINLPEIDVFTTKSGSMTQEIFYNFAKHFVANLKPDHDPKILFLDGHASRWSKAALLYLIENRVWPFFIASHTSIWAQPNDCGTNYRWHNCVEKVVRNMRREGGTPNVAYFNQVFSEAWTMFLDHERMDLREQGTNTTTSTYLKSGLHPLNPHCENWNTAINTLGRLTGKRTMQYEPTAKPNARALTLEEKTTLREGLALSVNEDMGDIYVGILRAGEILAKWREGIEKAVSEGAKLLEISKARLPAPSTPAQVLALDIVDLVEVDVNEIELPEAQSKEERAVEITENILQNTVIAEPIQITYLSSSSDDEEAVNESDDGEYSAEEMKGSATKTELSGGLPGENKWRVTIRKGGGQANTFEVKENDLLGSQYVIQRTYNNSSREQQQRMLAKEKRKRQAESRKKEKELAELAREKRKADERSEFENILTIVNSGRAHTFEEFSALLSRVRKPFTVELENRNVTVIESDAAVMSEESAVKAIGNMLVRKNWQQGDQGDNDTTQQPTSKRRRHEEACNTTRDATIVGAMRCTCRRNIQETAAYKKKQVSKLNAEKKSNEIILTMVSKRKEQREEAKKHRLQQQSAEPSPPSPSLGGEAIESSAEHQEMIEVEYWEVNETLVKDIMDIFLRLFVPESKVLSKNKPIKWCVIKEKALPVTKAQFNSDESTIQQYSRGSNPT